MLVLVLVLIATNLATAGALAWVVLRPPAPPPPDPAVIALRGPAVSTTGTRRLITIEILNAVELAATRGRLAGMAGTFAPGFVRRVVHDQVVRTVKEQLAAEGVVAEVRLHVLPPRPYE